MTARAGLDRLIDAAQAAGAHPRPARGDEHRAVGICHGGTSVGALVFYYDAILGKARVKCFAGCDKDTVLAALGLTRSDLWDKPISPDDRPAPRRIVRPAVQTPEPEVFDPAPFGWRPPADSWMPKWCGHTKTAEYVYDDEHGRVLFGVARCTNKDFAQWRPTPDNRSGRRWALTEKDDGGRVVAAVRMVPYRLRHLLAAIEAAVPVYVTEGEKDALAVAEAGAAATTFPGGASKWRDEYAAHFAGADIILVPDRDVPGRRNAQQLVNALLPVADRVTVALAASGKDPADHFAAGFGLDDLKTIWTPSRTEHAR